MRPPIPRLESPRRPRLTRASHIVPWAESEEHRAKPGNGLCLAATFDRSLVSLDNDFRVLLDPRLTNDFPNPQPERIFDEAGARPINSPEKNLRKRDLMSRPLTRHGFPA